MNTDQKSNWNVYSEKGQALPIGKKWSESQYDEALSFYHRLMNCEDSSLSAKIKDAIQCLEGAYRMYGPDAMFGSYNGGKDAVVVMHLMRAVQASYHQQTIGKDTPSRPKVIYFENQDEFPEVLSLLRRTTESFDLDMIAFDGFSFVDGLNILIAANKPTPLAFILGTRKGDPNAGSQGHFAPSSSWMPPFMRVNPVLEWSYGEIWHFLRLFQLPYCTLYDEGFTSLGTVKDTEPCPALARPQGGYWPAFMLKDFSQERAGRINKKKDKAGTDVSTVKTADTTSPSLRSDNTTTSTLSVSSHTRQKTVGLVIIGDEILKGLCADTNTHAAAKSLRARNVPLSRVVVVSDNHDEIVKEIHLMQNAADIIVTSGGVGPTHDDVTMKSVSTALSSPLTVHAEMVSLLQQKMSPEDVDINTDHSQLPEALMKMATLPGNAELRYLAGEDEWPILQCGNIFILPGVPQFFAPKIQLIASHISAEMERSETYKVVLCAQETSIVDSLNKVVSRHPYVSIGSYPFVNHPEYKTMITLESKEISYLKSREETSLIPDQISFDNMQESDRNQMAFDKEQMDLNVKLALADLLNELPQGSVVRVDNDNNLT